MKALMTVFFTLLTLISFSQVAQRTPINGYLPTYQNTSGSINIAIGCDAQRYYPSYCVLIGYGGNIDNFGKCNVVIADNLDITLMTHSYNWHVDYNCRYLQSRPVLSMQILAYEKAIKNTPHHFWPDVIIDLQQTIKNLQI